MKRLIPAIFLIGILLMSCIFTGGIGGSQTGSVLADPTVGIDKLENYQASLTITFQGTQDGKTADETSTYVQSEWPKLSAQFLSIDSVDDTGAHQVSLTGTVGQASYYQVDPDGPCTANWDATVSQPSGFLLASALLPVKAAKLVDRPDLDGIATQHYTLDAVSLNLPDNVKAVGEAWIAQAGGYVVKYVLDLSGSDALFGQGTQGTRHVEYALSQVGARPDVVYPAGCEPVLEIAAMNDAVDLTRLPGLLAFNTTASAEAALAFYQEKLTTLGWQASSPLDPNVQTSVAMFTRPDSSEAAIVAVEPEGNSQRVTVMIPIQSAAAPVSSSVTPPAASTASTNPAARVTRSVNILLGLDHQQLGPDSFHLEALEQSPVWAGGAIAQNQETMRADVQGENVHFIDQTKLPGGSNKTAEAYLMGDQEYDVVAGKVQPAGISMTGLTWKMWPLNLVMILATGATDASASGTETLEGRTAEVYTLNVSGATAPSVAGVGLPVTAVSGKVWVDGQTGALLKASLDYQADVHDASGNSKGSGSGHLELTVTQIGQVTVSLPGQ